MDRRSGPWARVTTAFVLLVLVGSTVKSFGLPHPQWERLGRLAGLRGTEAVQGARPSRYRCEGRFRTLIKAAAETFDFSPGLIRSVVEAESGCRRWAISPAGAVGLMQIVPHTGGRHANKLLGGTAATPTRSSLYQPATNLFLGTAYLRRLRDRFADGAPTAEMRTALALAAYNAGPTFVARRLRADPARKGGWARWARRNLPRETVAYVEAVMPAGEPGGSSRVADAGSLQPDLPVSGVGGLGVSRGLLGNRPGVSR